MKEKKRSKGCFRRTFTSDSGDSFGIENCPKLELFCFFFGDGMLVSWIKRRNNEQGQPIINRLTSYSSKLPKIAGRRR